MACTTCGSKFRSNTLNGFSFYNLSSNDLQLVYAKKTQTYETESFSYGDREKNERFYILGSDFSDLDVSENKVVDEVVTTVEEVGNE